MPVGKMRVRNRHERVVFDADYEVLITLEAGRP